MNKYCFGVDLGGTTVKLGLFTVVGGLLDKWEIPTRTEDNGSYILGDIAKAINEKMISNHLSISDIKGIGIGAPGPVINESIVLQCVNLGWSNVNVSKMLSRLTGLPVRVANDANAAALGEQWQGGGKPYDTLVMITLGTGVGGGIIINGRIVSGVNGSAGEIGHMTMLNPEDTVGKCRCGRRGCLEQAASATGVVNLAKKILAETDEDSSLRHYDEITAKLIFDEAKAGDAIAEQAANKMMMYLGKAAAHISCIINPEVFLIGGGVSKAGDYLIDGIRRYYRESAFDAFKDTPFVPASLGNDAGIFGAAKLICDTFQGDQNGFLS